MAQHERALPSTGTGAASVSTTAASISLPKPESLRQGWKVRHICYLIASAHQLYVLSLAGRVGVTCRSVQLSLSATLPHLTT
jgi:hypothetical protein